MSASWIMQVVIITLVAGFGLGFAIRFSLMARIQDRSRLPRVAPQLGAAIPANASTVPMDKGVRRAPTV